MLFWTFDSLHRYYGLRFILLRCTFQNFEIWVSVSTTTTYSIDTNFNCCCSVLIACNAIIVSNLYCRAAHLKISKFDHTTTYTVDATFGSLQPYSRLHFFCRAAHFKNYKIWVLVSTTTTYSIDTNFNCCC